MRRGGEGERGEEAMDRLSPPRLTPPRLIASLLFVSHFDIAMPGDYNRNVWMLNIIPQFHSIEALFRL